MRTYIPPILLQNPAALSAAIAALPSPLQAQLQQRMIWQQAALYQGAVGEGILCNTGEINTGSAAGSGSGAGAGLARSTMSTPSLTGSPVMRETPPLRGPPTPPSLFDASSGMGTIMKSSSAVMKTSEKKKGHKSRVSSAASESTRSESASSEGASPAAMVVLPAPRPPPPQPQVDIPLRVRVSALPRDKRVMFERASGDLWHSENTSDTPTLSRSEIQLLEDLYALIGSTQLREQTEVPDELVEPILDTLLLPRSDSHRGSRGGAAGHVCRWAGCGKVIKRLDHSRNHVREHVKSKPYSCGSAIVKGCGQRFLRTDDLKRHQKVHCSV